ncbi:MAG: phosphoadenylyl-sulfate reductase [Acidimicrobiales bacterium]
MSTTALPPLDELNELSARFEPAPAGAVIKWANERFGAGLVIAGSFQDAVLIDIAEKAAPGIEVVFLDTQYHFAETLWFVEEVRRRYDLNLRVIDPLVGPDNLWQTDVSACCGARKVEPLARALEGKDAWVTGLRRVDAATRANAPIVSWDLGRSMVKINPLAAWTDADMAGYIADHGLPVNPLTERGYSSVGCWPCTRPVAPGEDPRSGRWAGQDKTECGLHA